MSTIDRKCRSCGVWSGFVSFDEADRCVACHAAYGPLALGLDAEQGRAPASRKKPAALKAEAPKLANSGYREAERAAS